MTPLRQELRLLDAASNADGSPAWMIHDPVVNRFYRIGWLDLELLLRWSAGSVQAALDSLHRETTLRASQADVDSLLAFLRSHDLLQCNDQTAARDLSDRAAQRQGSVLQWLLHHYLFFRIPLVRPQAAMAALARWLWFLYTPAAAMVVGGLSATGVLLVLRQWETFTAAFVDQMSFSGAAGFALALVVSKAVHELGHAVTASRHGVRVAHMGVAVLVMVPMLYTDTGESWKLRDPRKRLAIASAGIVAELALAGLATLAWSLTPDGALRSALFFLATTGWILTLAVNASPFMRFDGYFIACDLVDMPNLHERSAAQARTWLRRAVLGQPVAWPEHFAAPVRRRLIVFAVCTWIYRLALYLSIAVMVYAYFFKLLGILLMLVEIWWFIMRPVHSELKVWWQLRSRIVPSRRAAIAGLMLALLAIGVLPWQSGVHGHGWLHPARHQAIHAPLAGRLVSLSTTGLDVAPGQRLFVLESPDLRRAAERARVTGESRARELVGLAGVTDGEDKRRRTVHDMDRALAESRLYDEQEARLQIDAPYAGRLVDVDPMLAAGVWVNPRQPLAMLVDPGAWVVDSFVAEEDLARLRVGDRATVQLAGATGLMAGKVVEIDAARTATLPHRLLDAQFGGPIATVQGAGAKAEGSPRASLFRIKIQLDRAPDVTRMAAVQVVIQGEPRSLLGGAFTHALSVVVRESGF
jgi:putative peptide zinc metalloprotease protein